MQSKKTKGSNFSRAQFSQSHYVRPDTEQQLTDYMAHHPQQSILVRGSGLSYNDSCFNTDHYVIDSQRLNHLISFDPETGIAVCQAAVPIKDLFLLHPDFIPPVLPGTVYATVAGGIAHDVHGKNNHEAGSFGHHVMWIELLVAAKKIRCSREENADLFYATIAGLGLTGVILRVALHMRKISRAVLVEHKRFQSIKVLTEAMQEYGMTHNYQVAWLDLLHDEPRSILSIADYCTLFQAKEQPSYSVPKVPFCLLNSWNMKLFNSYFFRSRETKERLSLQQFNNPLDKLKNWSRLYGSKGLIQFQAVLDKECATETLERLVQLIKTHKATPTLAVLKLFTQSGEGLLSFCKPGFTLAIDFIHNKQSINAITEMNQLITEVNGRIYLAKDWLLNPRQYKKMYENHQQFSQTLKDYGCIMHSDLATRLGILK